MNQAWVKNSYGNDFGNNQPDSKFCTLKKYLQEIKANGGNTVRVWVHTEGDYNPSFDSKGYVSGPGTLVKDMKKYALAA